MNKYTKITEWAFGDAVTDHFQRDEGSQEGRITQRSLCPASAEEEPIRKKKKTERK